VDRSGILQHRKAPTLVTSKCGNKEGNLPSLLAAAADTGSEGDKLGDTSLTLRFGGRIHKGSRKVPVIWELQHALGERQTAPFFEKGVKKPEEGRGGVHRDTLFV